MSEHFVVCVFTGMSLVRVCARVSLPSYVDRDRMRARLRCGLGPEGALRKRERV